MNSGGFLALLRANRNYRYTWLGQVVSEAGDNFNNVAVFSLALANTGSGLVVAGVLLSRAVCILPAGPIAGVLLDRMDRRRILTAAYAVDAAQSTALMVLALTGLLEVWMVVALSLVNGVSQATRTVLRIEGEGAITRV